jgi:hypothetical protein
MTPTHVQFKKTIKTYRAALDPAAVEILDDLIARLYPLKKSTPFEDESKVINRGVRFVGDHCNVVITTHDVSKNELVKEGNLELIKTQQFDTFAENRMYCEGTDGLLLELLTRYRFVETEKAIITATPNVCVWRDGKASLTSEDLTNFYDENRMVVTTIVFDGGFIVFTFEKKVKRST